MEALVLMGGFIAFVVFGCCLMGRLDSFLDGIPDEGEEQEPIRLLKIAVSNPGVVVPIARALVELEKQDPNIQFKLSMGQESEILRELDTGDVDIAVVSCGAPDRGLIHCTCCIDSPQGYSVAPTRVMLTLVGTAEQRQKIFWKDTDYSSKVQKFIRQLCGQKL